MIIEEKMKNIVDKLSKEGISSLYIKSALKEYLQSYVLNFIYGDSRYGTNFIFTGGTCLRKVYGINRLSEDLDFDLKEEVDPKVFAAELEAYFKKKYLVKDLAVSIKQQGRQVLLKFNIHAKLGLASPTESPLLYVKLDLSKVESEFFELNTKLLNDFDFSYIAKFYDIESLMAGKVVAILSRERLWGEENEETIKGRDYYDLLWFLERKTQPNFLRAKELLDKELGIKIQKIDDLVKILDQRVFTALAKNKEDLKRDLTPFISNNIVLSDYTDSYLENYKRESGYLIKRQ